MLRLAVIGLDTSHSVELPKRLNAPDCPAEEHVDGMTAVTCLRFPTPFQSTEGLDKRQAQLEQWGVTVTEDFDKAIADCDAILLEINDPSLHLEYFRRVAALGKPVFLDKPLAETLDEGRAIIDLARQHQTRVWSGSSLPFSPTFTEVPAAMAGQDLILAHCYGPYGQAPAGSSLIWYGVHTFEMVQKLLGTGAQSVHAIDNGLSMFASIDYADGRKGLAELVRGSWAYGGRLQSKGKALPFAVDNSHLYRDLLLQIRAFFLGGPAPVSMGTTFEGLAMMAAANESLATGKPAPVATL